MLIVDDYPGARYRRMRLLLDDGGFDVAEESLGREAVRRIAEERFDLAVVDLHLPDISGLDVVRGIRADPRRGHISSILRLATTESILTISVAEGDEAQRLSKDAGATAFVADAADAASFVSAVRQALG